MTIRLLLYIFHYYLQGQFLLFRDVKICDDNIILCYDITLLEHVSRWKMSIALLLLWNECLTPRRCEAAELLCLRLYHRRLLLVSDAVQLCGVHIPKRLLVLGILVCNSVDQLFFNVVYRLLFRTQVWVRSGVFADPVAQVSIVW